jgi:hypothetical protein
MRKKTMTDAHQSAQAQRAPERAGPLAGSKLRAAEERIAREAAMRRAVFVASLTTFLAVFGLIAGTGKPASTVNQLESAQANEAATSNQVIAEVPVADLTGDGEETIIRIVAPQRAPVAPRIRTRAS